MLNLVHLDNASEFAVDQIWRRRIASPLRSERGGVPAELTMNLGQHSHHLCGSALQNDIVQMAPARKPRESAPHLERYPGSGARREDSDVQTGHHAKVAGQAYAGRARSTF